VPQHCRMRAFDRDLIRGGHYGQRSREAASIGRTHGCSDQTCDVQKVLANTEPSTHGTSETYRDVCSAGGYRGMSGLLVDIANPSRLTHSGLHGWGYRVGTLLIRRDIVLLGLPIRFGSDGRVIGKTLRIYSASISQKAVA
jgi:hypothetical protein